MLPNYLFNFCWSHCQNHVFSQHSDIPQEFKSQKKLRWLATAVQISCVYLHQSQDQDFVWRRIQVSQQQAERQKKSVIQLCMTFHRRAAQLQLETYHDIRYQVFMFWYVCNISQNSTSNITSSQIKSYHIKHTVAKPNYFISNQFIAYHTMSCQFRANHIPPFQFTASSKSYYLQQMISNEIIYYYLISYHTKSTHG